MDDEEQKRHATLLDEQDKLRADLERARKRVGVDPKDLTRVVAVALARVGVDLGKPRRKPLKHVDTFRLDTEHRGLRSGSDLERCLR